MFVHASCPYGVPMTVRSDEKRHAAVRTLTNQRLPNLQTPRMRSTRVFRRCGSTQRLTGPPNALETA